MKNVYPACCAAKLNSWSSSSTLWKRWEMLKGGRKTFHLEKRVKKIYNKKKKERNHNVEQNEKDFLKPFYKKIPFQMFCFKI